MPHAVFDSTVLVSAFLAPKGVSAQLLSQARRGAFTLWSSEVILTETEQTLLYSPHIRNRYEYPDQKVLDFTQGLRSLARLVTNLPNVKGVSRDPNDDMVIACALAARALYLVTRDRDLLTLDTYQGVRMISPEEFMGILRERR